MQPGTGSTKRKRPGWDRRAWILSLVLAVIIAVLLAPLFLSALRDLVGFKAADDLALVAGVLAFIVAPPILAGLARRIPLLWAYQPAWALIGIVALFSKLADIGETAPPVPAVPPGSAVYLTVSTSSISYQFWSLWLFLAPLVTAGPVCLFRRRRRRARERRFAEQDANVQAVFSAQEGMWPPPPAKPE